eukprot:CAMPEP_0184338388 /NCGR_PEP_ID=MMETSP1089-20130417/6925_1 /TAXON_ID=38269 ORGANISM="Gloeochaete wittrockiana, Strain SAG46.84" /NCGR_SAMPLE_ID=MMETSP1089 /ASSEMBLY_ACC=CAM_ASM_000445 /LENGTH=82 /DNA_ID=CAMNT_0026664875 /DNA_START=865 /DNA_END=1110 /DNA_ORIENTATION=-
MTGRDVPDAYRQAKIKAEDRPLLVYELNGYWFISLCLDGAVGMGMTPDAASAYVDDTISYNNYSPSSANSWASAVQRPSVAP